MLASIVVGKSHALWPLWYLFEGITNVQNHRCLRLGDLAIIFSEKMLPILIVSKKSRLDIGKFNLIFT